MDLFDWKHAIGEIKIFEVERQKNKFYSNYKYCH